MRSTSVATTILVLISLVGCLEQLPAPDTCADDDDCTPQEVCSAGSCSLNIVDDPDLSPQTDDMGALDHAADAPDMFIPLPPDPAFYVQVKDDSQAGTPIKNVKLCVFADGTNIAQTLYVTYTSSAGTAVIYTDKRLGSDAEITLPADKKYRIWASYPDGDQESGYLPIENSNVYTPPQGPLKKQDIFINMTRCGGSGVPCTGKGQCQDQ